MMIDQGIECNIWAGGLTLNAAAWCQQASFIVAHLGKWYVGTEFFLRVHVGGANFPSLCGSLIPVGKVGPGNAGLKMAG